MSFGSSPSKRPNLSSIWSKGSSFGSSLEAKTTNLLPQKPLLPFILTPLLLVANGKLQIGFRKVEKKSEDEEEEEEEEVDVVVVVLMVTVSARPSIFRLR